MSTTNIKFTMKDLDGAVVPLTRFLINSGRPASGGIPAEVPYQTEFTTNVEGQATVALEASLTIPYYISKLDGASEQIINYKFYVPPSDVTLEAELLYVDLGMRNAQYNDKSIAALIEAKVVAVNAKNQALQVVSILGDVSTIRSNLGAIVAAGNGITVITKVAANMPAITAVSGNTAATTTVANNIAAVNTVAGSVANVTTVAGSIASVNAVSPIAASVAVVAANTANVTVVAGSIAAVNTVSGSIANVNAVANNATNINTTASINDAVSTVAANIADIQQTADGIGSIPQVMPYVANISTVAANVAPIVAVGNNIDNINEVRAMEADIEVIADNISNLAGAAAAVTQAVDARKETFVAGVDYTENTSTYLELDYFPAKSNSVKIFFNGVYQHQSVWTRVGKTISFTSPINVGEVEVQYDIPSMFVGLSPEDILVIQGAETAAEASATDAQQSASAAAVSASTALAASAQVADGVKELFVAGLQYTKNSSTQLTLDSTPAKTNTVKVFFNGLYQHSDTYTRVGTLLTFNEPIAVDQVEVQYEIPSAFVALDAADNAVLVAAQNAAQASANAAAASFDSFDDRYLGAKASAPTVDNDGNPLIVGAKYFHSIENKMYVRNSSNAWQAVDNAASITYLPGGTGAVSTTVQNKLRESVSVKDFGAVGDGVTDDTAAIQAAFNSCPVGSVLYFESEKTYKVSQINATGKSAYLLGYGATINCTGTVGAIYKTDHSNKLIVEGISFTGTGAGVFQSATVQESSQDELDLISCSFNMNSGVYGVRVVGGRNPRIQNCFFRNTSGGSGIYFKDTVSPFVQTCTFKGGGHVGRAIYYPGTGNGTDAGLILRDSEILGWDTGLEVVGCDWLVISGCTIDYNNQSIKLGSQDRANISENYIGSLGDNPALWLTYDAAGSSPSFCEKIFIVNNTFTGHSESGNNYDCIRLDGTQPPDSTVIANNSIAFYTRSGIYFSLSSQRLTVIGNTFAQRTGFGIAPIYNATGAGDSGVRIEGNYFANSTTIANMNISAICRISANLGCSTENRGETIAGTGVSTVTVAHGLSYTPAKSDVSLTATNGEAAGKNPYIISVDATNLVIGFTATTAASAGVAWKIKRYIQ